jgi:MFS family permease
LVVRGQFWIAAAPYAGTLLAAAVLYVVQFGLLLMLESSQIESEESVLVAPRTLRTIARQPIFIVAVLGGTVAYGVMSLIMTATPLSMHVYVAKVMSAGAIALMLSIAIASLERTYIHYWFGLMVLGVGWNFLYVGGTTMLTLSYSASERFKAQAVNEFSVFGTSAAASLLAGTVIYHYGWSPLVVLPLPVLLLVLVALFLIRKDARVSQVYP